MVTEEARQQLLQNFSNILNYPHKQLVSNAESLEEVLAPLFPESAEDIRNFLQFVENNEWGRLEEVYTGTFDVSPNCCPYTGNLLFGETYKRGEFLVKLIDKYKERGFENDSTELADHVMVMLRFLATIEVNDTLALELHNDCLLPAFTKMLNSFSKNEGAQVNPYYYVINACNTVLNGIYSQHKIEAPPNSNN